MQPRSTQPYQPAGASVYPDPVLGGTLLDSLFEPSLLEFRGLLENESRMALCKGLPIGTAHNDVTIDDMLMQEIFGGSEDSSSHSANGVYPSEEQAYGYRYSQSEIIHRRSQHADEKLGQLTPPMDNFAEAFPAVPSSRCAARKRRPGEKVGKLSNEERARKAANHRHHVSKRLSQGGAGGEGETGCGAPRISESLALQREKNRIAAAKFRAKKRAGREEREKAAREQTAANLELIRDVRRLTDQKSYLRSLILAHNPDVCSCHDIHHFNVCQARKLVFGIEEAGADAGAMGEADRLPFEGGPLSLSDYVGDSDGVPAAAAAA